jgi:hypothetical protein
MRRFVALILVLALAGVLLGAGALLIVRDLNHPIALVLGVIFALGFFWLLLHFDVDQARLVLEILGAVLPLVAFSIFAAMTPSIGSRAFREVGAQIIVVLLLALAIDTRFFRLRSDRDRFDLAVTIFTLILLGSGEFYALQGLFTGHPHHDEMVAGAIAAGFVAVAVSALMGPTRTEKTTIERGDPG